MEKNPSCKNMKDLHYGFNKVNTSPWNFSNIQFCNKNVTGEKWDSDFLPKSTYTCSFCKREFKSAQALGGHMNVHRRDRARLRQCYSPQNDTLATCNNVIGQFPPMLNLNLDPNTKKFPNLPSKLPPIVTLTEKDNAAAVPFFTDLMNGKRLFLVEKNVQEKIVKKAVRLELEIGVISDSKEEVMDLELRLGYST